MEDGTDLIDIRPQSPSIALDSAQYGPVAEWSNATGCKPVDLVFAGSNPARPTIKKTFTTPCGL